MTLLLLKKQMPVGRRFDRPTHDGNGRACRPHHPVTKAWVSGGDEAMCILHDAFHFMLGKTGELKEAFATPANTVVGARRAQPRILHSRFASAQAASIDFTNPNDAAASGSQARIGTSSRSRGRRRWTILKSSPVLKFPSCRRCALAA